MHCNLNKDRLVLLFVMQAISTAQLLSFLYCPTNNPKEECHCIHLICLAFLAPLFIQYLVLRLLLEAVNIVSLSI